MKRYGCREKGVEDVKRHKWFTGVDWNVVLRKEIPPPWVPEVKGMFDTHLFDEYPDSVEPTQAPPPDLESIFNDF